jgi:hypothetical protein
MSFPPNCTGQLKTVAYAKTLFAKVYIGCGKLARLAINSERVWWKPTKDSESQTRHLI